jgi:hypothetical protein
MTLYNTVHFLEFVLDLGTVKRVDYAKNVEFPTQCLKKKKKKEVTQSVFPQLLAKRDWHA